MLRNRVSSAKRSPVMPLISGALVSLRLRMGRAWMPFRTAMLIGSAQVVVLLHHLRLGQLLVHFGKKLGVAPVLRQGEITVPLDDDGLEIFGPHGAAAPQSPEMTVGVHVDAGHGRTLFPGRSDAQDAAVAGATLFAAQVFARRLHFHTPKILRLPEPPEGGNPRTERWGGRPCR